VIVISEQKLKFKNKHAEKLLDDLAREATRASDHSFDAELDQSSFILKAQIFKPEIKKVEVNGLQNLQSQPRRHNNVSLALLLEDPSILGICDRFKVQLNDGSTRVFSITKDSITLNNESCEMLLLQE